MSDKLLRISDYILLTVYFLLCVFFYEERTLFLDNAYQVFLLIQEDSISINANRWPVAVIRVFPLLLVKQGVPLDHVLLSFSLSYALFHAIVYAIIRFYIQDRLSSFILLASIIIPAAHSFFWCNSELIYGLSLLILMLSFLRNQHTIKACVVSFVIPWIHPLAILPALFFGVYFFLLNKKKLPGILMISGIIISASMKSIFFTSWYDQNKQDVFYSQLANYDLADNRFGFLFQWDFWPVVLSIIVCISICLLFKKYKELILYILFVSGYVILLDIMIQDYSLTFYHEVSYLVVFVVSIYLVSLIADSIHKYIYLAIFLLSIIGVLRLSSASDFYTQRIEWYKNELIHNDRVIYAYDEITYPKLIMEWGSPFESLLISSLQGKTKALLFARNPNDFLLDSEKLFINHFKNINVDSMDKRYFALEKKEYQLISK